MLILSWNKRSFGSLKITDPFTTYSSQEQTKLKSGHLRSGAKVTETLRHNGDAGQPSRNREERGASSLSRHLMPTTCQRPWRTRKARWMPRDNGKRRRLRLSLSSTCRVQITPFNPDRRRRRLGAFHRLREFPASLVYDLAALLRSHVQYVQRERRSIFFVRKRSIDTGMYLIVTCCTGKLPNTHYHNLGTVSWNSLYPVYTIQTAVKPVVKLGSTTGLTTGCIHDTTGCQTGLTTGLTTRIDNRLYRVNGA